MNLVSLHNVAVKFGNREILQSINVDIQSGEIATIIGPNGAGKSTLVKVITGLLAPTSGQVLCQPNLRVGYMPQQLRMDATMPMKVSRFLSLADPQRGNRDAVFERLNLGHLRNSQMHNLSGGETQRVLLARAILRKPNLLVLDEPLQGVDVTGQAQLYRLIASLREELGCAIVMVSHDLHLVMAQTDSVICLNQHVCCHGKPESVSRHPEYLRLFGRQVADDIAVYTHHHDHNHDLHGDVVDSGDQNENHHNGHHHGCRHE